MENITKSPVENATQAMTYNVTQNTASQIENLLHNHTQNTTSQTENLLHHLDQAFMVVHLLVGAAIIASNSLVVSSFARFEFVRTVENCFLLSLSVADLLTGMSLVGATLMTAFWSHSARLSPLCVAAGGLAALSFQLQIWSIQLLTVDRWLCVLYPLRAPRAISDGVTKVLVGLVWTILSAQMVGLMVYHRWVPGTRCFPFFVLNEMGVKYFGGPITCFPLCVMPVFYLSMCHTALKHARQIQDQQNAHADPTLTQRTQQLKTMKTLGLILGCLYVSWLPIIANFFVTSVESRLSAVLVTQRVVNNLAILAVHAGSLADPLIYHWSCPSVRKGLRYTVCPNSSREYYRNLALKELFGTPN